MENKDPLSSVLHDSQAQWNTEVVNDSVHMPLEKQKSLPFENIEMTSQQYEEFIDALLQNAQRARKKQIIDNVQMAKIKLRGAGCFVRFIRSLRACVYKV